MAGSTFGTLFTVTSFGESHGEALGVVVDGCPSGLSLTAEDIQTELNRRKPGSNPYGTKRTEGDLVQMLSGIFDGKTTGTPICMLIKNTDMRSHDYSSIKDVFRPSHADYTFHEKFSIRDYRGGGRSSGRETIARVAAGAVAKKILHSLSIDVTAFVSSIGTYSIQTFQKDDIAKNPLCMPDQEMAEKTAAYLDSLIASGNSVGGTIKVIVSSLPAGVGEPVFDKLDALLSHAIMSIGGVKAVEIGSGVSASAMLGSAHNDAFIMQNGHTSKTSNHAGGILGGISDGSDLLLTAHFKPTPSISLPQHTIDMAGNEMELQIKGRHDPVIVPRAVVVVESMVSITLLDLLMQNMTCRLDALQSFYQR